VTTFAIIPIYIVINLLMKLDFSVVTSQVSLVLVLARVLGKVTGISLVALLITRTTKIELPSNLDFKELVGIGFLAGMGLTVSLVIAKITVTSSHELAQLRMGLLLAALISGALGLTWLKRSLASLD
jgi:NhaA family Na+:H+ antiporter